MAAEHEDEDEVLLAMAEELGKLVEHVGGAQVCACVCLWAHARAGSDTWRCNEQWRV